jgi:acetate kinase
MMKVLAINSGSVSLKVKILEFDESPKTAARFTMNSRYEGFVEEIGFAARLPVTAAYSRLQQTLHE